MNKEQARANAAWIDALNSGKYQQTRGSLRDGLGFCCIGVRCDISGEGRWDDTSYVYSNGNRDGGSLDFEKFTEWFGIDYEFQSKFVNANDDDKMTFPEIADIAEEIFEQEHPGWRSLLTEEV